MSYLFQTWNEPVTLLEEHNLAFPFHLHKTAELVIVQEGSMSITISNQKYLLHEGNILVIFPGQLHEYNSHKTGSKSYIIIFDTTNFPEYMEQFQQFHPSNPFIPGYLLDSDVFLAIERLYSPSITPNLKAAWLNLILAHIFPILHLEKNTEKNDTHLISRIIEYLSIHFTEPVTLDLLAKEMHINKFHLSHTFADKFHSSLTEYLNKLRTEKAARLLTTTNYSIEKTGALSGFETQRTFNRVFKSQTGLTPSAYRKKYMKS